MEAWRCLAFRSRGDELNPGSQKRHLAAPLSKTSTAPIGVGVPLQLVTSGLSFITWLSAHHGNYLMSMSLAVFRFFMAL